MIIKALAATLALSAPALATLPQPSRNAGYFNTIIADFTAEHTATYRLNSTYFRLGTDPWGRVKQVREGVAGQPVSFVAFCNISRGSYSYRVERLHDGLVVERGPILYTKCV